MFRLIKLNFKNAMMTSETLFGLGLELADQVQLGLHGELEALNAEARKLEAQSAENIERLFKG